MSAITAALDRVDAVGADGDLAAGGRPLGLESIDHVSLEQPRAPLLRRLMSPPLAAIDDAWRAANRESEKLDRFNKYLVKHAVAVSSAHAARKIRLLSDDDQAADEAAKFAADAKQEDTLARGAALTSKLGNLVGLSVIGGVVLAGLVALSKLVLDADDAGYAVGHSLVVAGVSTGAVVAVIRIAAQSGQATVDAIKESLHGALRSAEPAKKVLANTLDQPEKTLLRHPWIQRAHALGD